MHSPAFIQLGVALWRFPGMALTSAICSSMVREQHRPRTVPVWRIIRIISEV